MYMYRGCVSVGTLVLVYYPRKIDYNDRVARLHGYNVRVPFDVAWAGFRTTVSWQVGKQTSERSKAGKLAMRDWNVSRPFEPCSPPHLSTTLRPHPASPSWLRVSIYWPLPVTSSSLFYVLLYLSPTDAVFLFHRFSAGSRRAR